MKTCRKCNTEKLESEFYKHSDNPDGLDWWCKNCRGEDNRSRIGKHKLAKSTEEAILLFSQEGIPATAGIIAGRPGKDIVLFGYLSVEAKGTDIHQGRTGYKFGFTKAQKVNPCDFYILLFRDVNRVFVIPGGSPLLEFNGKKLCLNINNPALQKYEDAYDLIRQRVLADLQLRSPIESVQVYAYGDRYVVSG